jgi:N-acetyl-1-D-myo-inositol-2-amino-2-deoxy-alpha-D-glucopyranoside deacetylase
VTDAIAAVVAHPDDESLIAGGTLALAAGAGTGTGVISLTRGEHGPISAGVRATSDTLGEIRERELQVAAQELGVDWTACLHYPDGELPLIDHETAADELAALLALHATVAVLTFGPDGLYWHPDHIAARTIVSLATRRLARQIDVYEAAWPSGLMAQLVAAAQERGLPTGLWGLEPEAFGSDRSPTVVIDIRSVLGRKLAALRAHRTQVGADHLFAALPEDLAERFMAFEHWAGPEHGTLQQLISGG